MAYSAKTDWKLGDTVQPEDMIRIESGIRDLDVGKAANNLSNVAASSLSAKAKEANIEVFPTAALMINVNGNTGNDTTGTGASGAPFKTIARAIQAIPESNPSGVDATIYLNAGNDPGFTLKSNKRFKLMLGTSLSVGTISIYNGRLEMDAATLTGGLFVYGGVAAIGNLIAAGANNAGNGVFCESGVIHIDDKLTVTGHATGVRCVNGQVFIKRMEMASGATGVSCNCGAVYIGEETIAATAKYEITFGGRVFVGAETFTQG